MQLPKTVRNFDQKKVEELLVQENKFISELFSSVTLPTRENDEESEENDTVPMVKTQGKPRAKSLTELKARLQAITSKKTITYKEKLVRKKLKNRLKKKTKQVIRVEKQSTEVVKPAKPVYDSDGKMVFSKFDFSNLGAKKQRKEEKDPRRLLEKLEEKREKWEELEEEGEVGRVVQERSKEAWKGALAKAEGRKVKDDVTLLKKTVKKDAEKKRASRKKWEKRLENVEKGQRERQEKRKENIDKRKKEKKVKKMKKAVKKGKIIPGF